MEYLKEYIEYIEKGCFTDGGDVEERVNTFVTKNKDFFKALCAAICAKRESREVEEARNKIEMLDKQIAEQSEKIAELEARQMRYGLMIQRNNYKKFKCVEDEEPEGLEIFEI